MSTSIKTDPYVTLLNDITALYDVARHALVEAYWQIGKRIVEQEQQGQENAVYGDHLLDQLSEDLSETLGHGFSKRNLYKMRQFYLTHKIVPPVAQLTWTEEGCAALCDSWTVRQCDGELKADSFFQESSIRLMSKLKGLVRLRFQASQGSQGDSHPRIRRIL